MGKAVYSSLVEPCGVMSFKFLLSFYPFPLLLPSHFEMKGQNMRYAVNVTGFFGILKTHVQTAT